MLSDATSTDSRAKHTALSAAVAAGDTVAALSLTKEILASSKVTDISFCATALKGLREPLLAGGHRLLKTFIVRSITIEPALAALQVEAMLAGYVLDLQVGGFGSYMEEMLNPAGALSRAQADLVFLLLDLEDIAGQLPILCASGKQDDIDKELDDCAFRIAKMVEGYRSGNKGRLVVSGCVVPHKTSLGAVGDANVDASLPNAVKEFNRRLTKICRSIPDCLFFDLDAVAADFGRERWRDTRMFLASRLPFSPGAFRPLAHGFIRTASAMFRQPRKVLCTDLDNTVWGGILGEDGPSGIATGAAFPGNCYLQYQAYLKELSKRGILLAITSKNNEVDVVEAFQTRSSDLALAWNDFVAHKISWDDKVSALRELSIELSLGLDSFVFIDDNPVECEAVRRELPQVAVLQVPVTEPWRLTGDLADAWYFDTANVTRDDLNRSEEYKAQAQRAALGRGNLNRDDFLQSLHIVCTFLSAADAPLSRSVQLLAKTNQFNLTTRRRSEAEVLQFVTDPACMAVAVRIRDRFGDSGVVGLALTQTIGDRCCIDSLLLSCRVIGRGIETAILAYIAKHAAESGARTLVGEYVPTLKSKPCESFYPDHHFMRDEATSTSVSTFYRLELADNLPKSPPWLSLERDETHEHANRTAEPS